MKSVKLNLFFLGIFILFTVHSFAQVQVSGTVIDNTGDSLPGVSILVKGTSRGGVTDLDGRYSLQAPDDQSILVFSYVGMQTQEVNINGRSTIDVT